VLLRDGWPTPSPSGGEVFEELFQILSGKFTVLIPSNQDHTIVSWNFFFGLQRTWSDIVRHVPAGSSQCKCRNTRSPLVMLMLLELFMSFPNKEKAEKREAWRILASLRPAVKIPDAETFPLFIAHAC
jgi:hypothetical protein